jgi:putative Mg2+ transporter-C (MgtC) family protein
VVGLERELDAQRAGLRTHMLVALGAALFTVAGTGIVESDPVRIAAQVVAGVGFLGGGAILREGATVHGLTTAASLWVTAALGVAVGLERWVPAVVATIVTVVVLRVLKLARTELWLWRSAVEVTVELSEGSVPERVEEQIATRLPGARTMRVRCSADGWSLMVTARPRPDQSLAVLGRHLMEIEGISRVELTG